MCYKVAVRRDGQDDVLIKAEHKELSIEEHYEGGVAVELTYNEGKLALYDPAGYKAIRGAWPTVDELVLHKHREDATDPDDEWEEVFAGVVTKVVDGNGEITIGGHMKDEVPPNPLTVDVQEDTDDATRMSVIVRTDNDEQGTVTLDLGDGTTPVSNPGDGTSGSQHAFATPGTYTVTAKSDSDPEGRQATQVVTVPFTA